MKDSGTSGAVETTPPPDPRKPELIAHGPVVVEGFSDGWPKLALCHFSGKLRPGLVATGIHQFVKALLGCHRFDLRQIRALVSQKSR